MGFTKAEGFECLYVHMLLGLFLSVYVDDFKMAGRKDSLAKMWKILGTKMELEPSVPLIGNVYLGCGQIAATPDPRMVTARSLLYDAAQTSNTTPTSATPGTGGGALVRGYAYDMKGHVQQSIDRYLELSKKLLATLTSVATPCIDDHMLQDTDFTHEGVLCLEAARIVLKSLYVARMGRPDLLWAVNSLARCVTKWTVAADKRLHRLMCWMEHTKDWVQTCWVGDPIASCCLMLFADASFAGDTTDAKSTSGGYLCLCGPRTFVPITWLCKKQTSVSHSSSEAEVVALDAATRMEGIPALLLLEQFTTTLCGSPGGPKGLPDPQTGMLHKNDRKENISISDLDYVPHNIPKRTSTAKLIIMEDNEAVIQMCKKGRSPNMRHVSRTHRVSLDWLFERLATGRDEGIHMKWVDTLNQIADIMTKGSFTAQQWLHLCMLCQLGPVGQSVSDPLAVPIKKPKPAKKAKPLVPP